MATLGALDPNYIQWVEKRYDICNCGCNLELTATLMCPMP